MAITKFRVIKPGSTPKLITSANESRSFPIGLDTFRALAMRTSNKSRNAAKNMRHEASIGIPINSKRIPKHPHTRFRQVIKFGMLRLMAPITLDLQRFETFQHLDLYCKGRIF